MSHIITAKVLQNNIRLSLLTQYIQSHYEKQGFRNSTNSRLLIRRESSVTLAWNTTSAALSSNLDAD